MNMQIQGGSSMGAFGVFAGLSILFGIVSAIFWMVVGWRAMRAHERIADVGEGWLRIRREERLAAINKAQGASTALVDAAEDKFTPLKDAPPEYPWSKEV